MDRIKQEVRKYLDKNSELLPDDCWSIENTERIIDMGTNLLMKKWGLLYSGGSFVDSICSNDLIGAINHADEINRQALIFYVKLYINCKYID